MYIYPFPRLLSGYRNKILGAYKGSHHDKLSRKILETYRGLLHHQYKFRKTVPTFSEFVSYMLDTYEKSGEVDMHWAPVVDFCSVCQVLINQSTISIYLVSKSTYSLLGSINLTIKDSTNQLFYLLFQVNFTHILDFEHLYEDMINMLPKKKHVFKNFRSDTIKLNANKKGPITNSEILKEYGTLKPELFRRLCKFYAKDFEVFGFVYPNIKWNGLENNSTRNNISTSKPIKKL